MHMDQILVLIALINNCIISFCAMCFTVGHRGLHTCKMLNKNNLRKKPYVQSFLECLLWCFNKICMHIWIGYA